MGRRIKGLGFWFGAWQLLSFSHYTRHVPLSSLHLPPKKKRI